jgi:hypothetical protein
LASHEKVLGAKMKSTAAPNIRSSGQALSCLPLNSNVENITANSTSMKSMILKAKRVKIEKGKSYRYRLAE